VLEVGTNTQKKSPLIAEKLRNEISPVGGEKDNAPKCRVTGVRANRQVLMQCLVEASEIGKLKKLYSNDPSAREEDEWKVGHVRKDTCPWEHSEGNKASLIDQEGLLGNGGRQNGRK